MARTKLSQILPDFPWDSLAELKATAAAHPHGMVNLSVGSPVDAVAPSIQLALSEAAGFPGYPQTIGTPQLRAAIIDSARRRYRMEGLTEAGILPVVGTKEAIAWLPKLLGLGAGDTVVIPEVAYPTYEVGARLAGADVVRSDGPTGTPALMFINSPANPTGRVLSVEQLRELVTWAQANDVILASDECYLGLGWDDNNRPRSVLDPEVSEGNHTNLLALHSLSKTSNLAGYRAGFIAGDEALVAELTEVRKHAGLMMPYPIQAAMVAALGDDEQEAMQKLRYAARRERLRAGLLSAGFEIHGSEAGLYLWATRGENGRDSLAWLAERGILAAPGDFYGPASVDFVRFAITATDERIAAACERLQA